jgi:ribosome-binding protein aMBF1 (putative translation factor)
MIDIKQTRDALGLSASQMAEMLETDELSIRRMEMSPAAKNHRKPARRMARLMQAYLDGWRPPDWPS